MTEPRPRRTIRLSVRVTPAEREILEGRSEECGLSLSDYLRSTALGAMPRRRPGQLQAGYARHLARIGNNLNQLARVANTTGRIPAQRQLEGTLAALRQVLTELTLP